MAGPLWVVCLGGVLVILRRCRYRLVRHVRLFVEPFPQQIPDAGLDAIDELRIDGGFIEFSDHEACLFADESGEHLLSLVTRLAHTLEGSKRVRQHKICGVVEQQPLGRVGVTEDAIDAAPRPVEVDAQVREKVTLERVHEEILQDPQGRRFRYVEGVFERVQKVQDQDPANLSAVITP